ncbi:hypothetical protein D0A34_17865 [Microcoleus vaginatus PCC 9802]|nr:hypothetical protein D0A34_17865 [Microcoleus vaginatus PCC 9802]
MGKTPQQNRVCSPSRKADARKAGVLGLAFRQEAGWPTLANHKSLITIFCGAVAFEVESLCWRAGDGVSIPNCRFGNHGPRRYQFQNTRNN